MNAAAEVIYDLVDPSANLIFGAVIDQSLSGQVSLEGLEIYIYIYIYIFGRVVTISLVLKSECACWTSSRSIEKLDILG